MKIGVTGTFSGGKDLVAGYLVSRGFNHVSTGDLVREEATKRKIVWTRKNLQTLANELRAAHGPGYLAKLALTKFSDNVVVSGLRNMGEIKELQKGATGFLLISVDAPKERRYKWAKQRGKLTDDVDLVTFTQQEEYEKGHERTGLQLEEVMAAADVSIWNNGTREKVFSQVSECLSQFFGVVAETLVNGINQSGTVE